MSEEMKAFDELCLAAGVFQKAILQFKKTVDTSNVGLLEWADSIDETLDEIQAELDSEEQ